MTQYKPAMYALRAQLMAALGTFMEAREQDGMIFSEAAIDASAVIGDLLCAAFAPISNDTLRAAVVERFCHHLPGAVANARALALVNADRLQ